MIGWSKYANNFIVLGTNKILSAFTLINSTRMLNMFSKSLSTEQNKKLSIRSYSFIIYNTFAYVMF